MSKILQAAAAAVVGLVGTLTLMNLAGAQEATDTPSTSVPAVEAPAPDAPAQSPGRRDHDCPRRDGSAGRNGTSTDGGTSTDDGTSTDGADV